VTWLSDLDKIDRSKVAFGLLGFLATVGPGFLIVYLFKPELIEKLDIVKLTIFSCALTTPLLMTNVLANIVIQSKENNEGEIASVMGTAFASHIISSYSAIFLAYWFHWEFLRFVWWALGFSVGVSILIYFVEKLPGEKHKKNPK